MSDWKEALKLLDPVIRDPHSGELVDFDKDVANAKAAICAHIEGLEARVRELEDEVEELNGLILQMGERDD